MDFAQTQVLAALLNDFIQRNRQGTEHAAKILHFIAQTPTPWRSQPVSSDAVQPAIPPHASGHVTASAWVLNAARTHAALLHHRKLGLWLQPGGHVEETDTSWLEASKREVIEETGLTQLSLSTQCGAGLFDVDTHDIPARPSTATRAAESAHVHFDLRFLWIAAGAQSLQRNVDESLGLQWFELHALAADETLDPSVRRMAMRSVSGDVGLL